MEHTSDKNQKELFESYLLALRNTARKKKTQFLEEHARWVRQQESVLRKQFGIKKSEIENVEGSDEPKKRAKKAKKRTKRGQLKEAVMSMVKNFSDNNAPITTGTLLEALIKNGFNTNRNAVFTVLHRETGKSLKVKKRGVGKKETFFELEGGD